jgi:microcystin-dependent protein
MDAFVGEIMAFGGDYAPVNWTPCQGQTVSLNQYQLLYALIGTTYGGDGRTTVGLPNMQGIIPIGTGTGPNLGSYTLGQAYGVPQVTARLANIPAHTHSLLADSSSQPGQASPTNAYLTNTVTANAAASSAYVATTAAGTPVAMNASAVTHAAGASVPNAMNNFMPTMAMTWMICLQGLFPTRP